MPDPADQPRSEQHTVVALPPQPKGEQASRRWLAALPHLHSGEPYSVSVSSSCDAPVPHPGRWVAPNPEHAVPVAAAIVELAAQHPEHAATLVQLAATRARLLTAGYSDADQLVAKLRGTQQQLDELQAERDQLDVNYHQLRSHPAVRALLLAAAVSRRPRQTGRRVIRRVAKLLHAAPRRLPTAARRTVRRLTGGQSRTRTSTCPSCRSALQRSGDSPSLPQARTGGANLPHARPLSPTDPVTVVIPVFRAADHAHRCVRSVQKHTDVPYQLVLIDDGSQDPKVDVLLEKLRDTPQVTVLVNDTNLGFTATVNRGMRLAHGDVVLLNSDTEVGPHWLRNLWLAAYSAPDVASATALSDNAGAFSAPQAGQPNPLPAYLDGEDAARLVAQQSERHYPDTPTANGFCVYLRRDAIDSTGLFDQDAFPRGYGEENDWSMRAAAAGWRHVVDDATYVHHARSVSFGDEKQTLILEGRTVIDQRWPAYTAQARAFGVSPAMATVRTRVAHALSLAVPRRRVLFLLHNGGGGTPQTNADLMRQLADRHDIEPYLTVGAPDQLEVFRLEDGQLRQLETVRLDPPVQPGDTTHPTYRDTFERLLVDHAIDIVHIRQLVKQPLHDVVTLTKQLHLPLVVSLHDFYLACPTIQLLDENGRFCNAECTTGAGPCPLSMQWLQDGPAIFTSQLKHEGVHEWRQITGPVLAAADMLITTSPTARELYQRVFAAETDGTPFHIIPHGRDLADAGPLSEPPTPGRRLRVLVPGNLNVAKGAAVLEQLRKMDTDGRLEFHLLGKVPARWQHLGVDHGTYSRGEFAARVADIAPQVAAILSPWPETYSHTLSECWSAGVPVVASDLGALGERLRAAGGGGWLVDPEDVAGIYDRLVAIADDPDGWQEMRAGATTKHLRSEAAMAADYAHVYLQAASSDG